MSEKAEIKLITLKIKNEMLKEWDKYCEKRGLTRSQFIRECVNQTINQELLENIENVVKFYMKGLEARLSTQLNRIEVLIRAKTD